MTATTATPVLSIPNRTADHRTFRRYAVFAFWACLYILPIIRLFLVGTDEGTLDYGAVRIAHGQVFARDFFEVMGPGTFYWLALFFKLFGITFLATRICLFISSMGTALLMYFLSRRVCTTYQMLPSIILAGTIFSGLWPATSHHIDSTFFALLAVACIALWRDTSSRALLFAAGALAGWTTAFLQPKGILVFLAFLVWISILCRRRIASLSSLGIVTAGYLSVVGLIALYFWSHGALGSLIFTNFTWPSQHYSTVNSVSYAHGILSGYFDHWVINQSGLRWTIPLAMINFVPLLFVAALPILLLLLGAPFRWNVKRPDILLYWLCGIAICLSELHRMDMPRVVFGSPLLIILGVHFLTEYRSTIAKSSLQILQISAASLSVFNLLCVVLAAQTIPTRVGSVKMLKDAPVLAYLDEHVAPGEEIFAYPYCPRYYFLSSTTNPTPYSILVYNYNTPSQFQEVVRILEQRKVKYVLWDNGFAKGTVDVFPGASQPPPGGFIVEPYLESHYKLVQVVGGIRIMERNSQPQHN
jgi:hypothetical protein